MRYTDLDGRELPLHCPNEIKMGGGGCGAKFISNKNLFQDTDGVVYCSNCGIAIGAFPLNTIPVRRRGIYAIQKENG